MTSLFMYIFKAGPIKSWIAGILLYALKYLRYVIFTNHAKTKFLRLYFRECQKIGGFYILVKHVQH